MDGVLYALVKLWAFRNQKEVSSRRLSHTVTSTTTICLSPSVVSAPISHTSIAAAATAQRGRTLNADGKIGQLHVCQTCTNYLIASSVFVCLVIFYL